MSNKRKNKRKKKPIRAVRPRTNHYGKEAGGQWTQGGVEDVICNPLYTGVGPFPALIDDTTYVRAAAKMIREIGPERYLHMMLSKLREGLGRRDEDAQISDSDMSRVLKAMLPRGIDNRDDHP